MYKAGIEYLWHPQRGNSFNRTTKSTSTTPSIIFSRHLYQIEIVAMCKYKSSVKRRKGESQNGCYKKTNHAKFSKNQTFLTLCHVKNIREFSY